MILDEFFRLDLLENENLTRNVSTFYIYLLLLLSVRSFHGRNWQVIVTLIEKTQQTHTKSNFRIMRRKEIRFFHFLKIRVELNERKNAESQVKFLSRSFDRAKLIRLVLKEKSCSFKKSKVVPSLQHIFHPLILEWSCSDKSFVKKKTAIFVDLRVQNTSEEFHGRKGWRLGAT